MTVTGSCDCGGVKLEATTSPPMRFFCHCATCQKVYGSPYADITALWRWKVRVTTGSNLLSFRRYAWLPASVKRGLCRTCARPVIGYLQVPPAGVAFCPTAIWSESTPLPDPVGHVFYHRRTTDVDDGLPKIAGLMKSELIVTRWLLPRLIRAGL